MPRTIIPQDDHNFLRDWKNGNYPAGWDEQAGHLGFARRCTRIREVGRQAAAARMGMAVRGAGHGWPPLPMGQRLGRDAVSRCRNTDTIMRGPTTSMRHPRGASPFGVMDMVGNVWQWTDEFQDEHTRAGILRGGSHYQPQGSHWYFPRLTG